MVGRAVRREESRADLRRSRRADGHLGALGALRSAASDGRAGRRRVEVAGAGQRREAGDE